MGLGYLEQSSLYLFICPSSTGEMLAHTLKAFTELMEHDFVSWENLSTVFIKKVRVFYNVHSLCLWDSFLSLCLRLSLLLTDGDVSHR